VLLPCVCYLPPENSSRYFDVNGFFDTLLFDIYKYKQEGIVFLCGDFNSRCVDLDECIRRIDSVSNRNGVDFKANINGDLVIDFLVNVNMCMLTGRWDNLQTDFTSISTKGLSVVDYCITTHDMLHKFSHFTVSRSSFVASKTGILDAVVQLLFQTILYFLGSLMWNGRIAISRLIKVIEIQLQM